MQTFRRTVAVLIFPAIAYWGAACERDTPTGARPGGRALSVSGDLTDALSTDLGQSYQVILSCTDGHSVILWVDAATLTSLAGDVEAIKASDTGVSCTLGSRALDPSSQTTIWTVDDYNPSNNALAPRNAPSKLPASTSASETKFHFLPGTITATVGDPAEWSDWNGQPASSPDVSAAFEKAIHHVQTVGLSFSGLCFVETGVIAEYPSGTPPPDEVFSSTFSEMPTP